jgi:hypothetical protein
MAVEEENVPRIPFNATNPFIPLAPPACGFSLMTSAVFITDISNLFSHS